jgi:hypothetical protein
MALHAAYCGKLVDFTAQGQLITAPRFELGAIGAGLHERRYHKLLVKKSFQDRGTGARRQRGRALPAAVAVGVRLLLGNAFRKRS